MRLSKAQADANRAKVVAAAAKLFRERGVAGATVADVMEAAGFSHGGFYNHFESKEALAADAIAAAFGEMARRRSRAGSLAEIVEGYLSETARAAPGRSCPAAALAADAARGGSAERRAFADGLAEMADSIAERLRAERPALGPGARSAALALIARLAGAIALSRAAPDDDALAREILDAALSASLAEINP